MQARGMAAVLPLLLLLSMEAGADEQLDCAGGAIDDPTPPASLVEHRVTMAYAEPAKRTAALTAEDMVTARKARHEMRTLFDPRSSLEERLRVPLRPRRPPRAPSSPPPRR